MAVGFGVVDGHEGARARSDRESGPAGRVGPGRADLTRSVPGHRSSGFLWPEAEGTQQWVTASQTYGINFPLHDGLFEGPGVWLDL